MRFFNTAGPIVPADHYFIPPLARLDLDEVLLLIRQKKYFVLHAPRQTGKTSVLLALQDLLNARGDHRCVYVNVEAGQVDREDTARAMRTILAELSSRARSALRDEFVEEVWPRVLERNGSNNAFREVLTRWAEADPKPLVLLIDEIDALVGDTLLSVLRQLRSGYDLRPDSFPQSVVLCGLRDVRDYRIRSTADETVVAGGSAFNVKAVSLRLGDFSRDETLALLEQHTAETGQTFAEKASDLIWEQTRGQPWLVNALAYETCRAVRDRAIADDDVAAAREALILRRETHLDILADRLREERVRRVVEPLLSGGERSRITDRAVEYARDLGLLARDAPLRIANPIYAEVVPRELTWIVQEELDQDMAWYVDAEGRLDMEGLMAAFQTFFRENSEHWRQRFDYQEAWPQLLLQAFLQRVVNGGGRIEREFGLGRRRVDLLILWTQGSGVQRFVVECKVLRRDLDATIAEGLERIADYMDGCAAEAGHLVIFDRDEKKAGTRKSSAAVRSRTSRSGACDRQPSRNLGHRPAFRQRRSSCRGFFSRYTDGDPVLASVQENVIGDVEGKRKFFVF